MQFLFLEPNASDPLNKDAAAVLQNDRDLFRKYVKASMQGQIVKGEAFHRVVK